MTPDSLPCRCLGTAIRLALLPEQSVCALADTPQSGESCGIHKNPHNVRSMPKQQDTPPHAEWLLPRDVADVFGVSTDTVTRWANAGRLPVYVMPSGHRRYKRADIDAILAKQASA